MNNARMTLDVCRYSFRKWVSNPRIYVIGILLAIYISTITTPIAEMCRTAKIAVSPWIFPFIVGNFDVLPILMFGIILLFCDAPFLDSGQPYIIVRSGKKVWLFGQFIYILLATIIYFLYILLLSIMFLLPVMRYQNGWGKIITTLCNTDVGAQFQIMNFNYKILQDYTPLQSVGFSLLMAILVGSFIGLLIFTINLKLNRIIGVIGAIIAAAPVLLIDTKFFNEFYFIYYSPVAWASLAKLDPTGVQLLPTVGYAIFWLGILILVLCILSLLFIRKKEIEVLL